jgi:ComF family protein
VCAFDYKSAGRGLGDFLFPALCRYCGGPASRGAWAPLLCRECGDELPLHDAAVGAPPPVARAWSLALFEGPARKLLIDLKYEGVVRAGTMIGARMAAADGAEVILDGAQTVVPVPLHWRRRWRRGHNQAAVLARALCRDRRELQRCNALRRRRATPPQVGLKRHQRLGNVIGAFAVAGRCAAAVEDKVVVLVDDVITTGATAAAAASALIDAGAAEVRAYAAAWARD